MYLLPQPTDEELAKAVEVATSGAVSELFHSYPSHTFYYCALITTGEALAPVMTAWSYEMLKESATSSGEAEDELKWSYADSPVYCFGERHFDAVKSLFRKRPPVNVDSGYCALEHASRLAAMELALARVDAQGLFGAGARRNEIYINVEIMPPDFSNVERALRLNPREAIVEWLRDAAELDA